MSSTAVPLHSGSDPLSPHGDAWALAASALPPECDHDSELEPAGDRARSLAGAVSDPAAALRVGALALVSGAVAGLALERPLAADEVERLAGGLAAIAGIPADEARLGLFRDVLADSRLTGLPPVLAIETTVQLLAAFAPAAGASFWLRPESGPARCVARSGAGARRMRAAASAALSGSPAPCAAPVRRWRHVAGAVAAAAAPEDATRAAAYVGEAARALGPALEREQLLDRSAARERSLVAAGERRLTRLGFDIHDGPLQDLSAARRELTLARAAAGETPAGEARRATLAQLVHLEEALVAGERGLRELAHAAQPGALLGRPFRTVVEQEVARFTRATEIPVDLRVEGDLEALSGSQRIALAHIVQEALNNVREHSSARSVRVSLVRRPGRVEAEVTDDGRGFDVRRTLVRAARGGRLGLVGMNERALLLGGALDLSSRPGGPTTVAVTLPEWRPLEAAAPALAGLDPPNPTRR